MRAQVISQNEITMLLRSRKGYSVENNCSIILHPFLTIVCRMTMFRSLMPTEESCRHFPISHLFQNKNPFISIPSTFSGHFNYHTYLLSHNQPHYYCLFLLTFKIFPFSYADYFFKSLPFTCLLH